MIVTLRANKLTVLDTHYLKQLVSIRVIAYTPLKGNKVNIPDDCNDATLELSDGSEYRAHFRYGGKTVNITVDTYKGDVDCTLSGKGGKVYLEVLTSKFNQDEENIELNNCSDTYLIENLSVRERLRLGFH